ncbi:MAG: 2-amino-4-hydroxy-6-hydroxymethyldihydropteridine diphosphokinase [Elusimicrobia bacterium RIFCSPLOWO2_01_FULL_64_13]|nr:MAG: 2-amino-4-hydroxy-6-hydroxymethyldihydropteridine diphosphokinase [Elusimicrobia bacterium RIFCSPLOWO2_01_FULL_64_13]
MKRSPNRPAAGRWQDAFIGLGSNLGRREDFLRKALKILLSHPAIKLVRASGIYSASPVGPPQPDFLNAAVHVRTVLPPRPLFRFLMKAERSLGRRRSGPSSGPGPRVIDLDLLLYGSRRMRSRTLTLPHPRMAGRKFVLVPLREIAPDAVVPGPNATVARLRRELTARGQKVKLCPHLTW